MGVDAVMQPITEWAVAHEPEDKMIFKGGFWPQVMLVRDQIARIVSETYDEWREKVRVYGTHTSKSIKLPVFFFEAQGARFWLRYNFHDWNVSVESDKPFGSWAEAFDDAHGYCFCQGMEDKKFSPFSGNVQQFTLCISDHYELYTFFWLFRRERGIVAKKT